MNNEEAVKTLILFCLQGGGVIDAKVADAIRLAIRSMETLQEVKKIIDIDNSLVQEDVMKYKMICELVEKALGEVEE